VRATALAAAVVIASCRSARVVVGPSGGKAVSLSCYIEADCLEDPGSACPTGYQVLTRDSHFRWWSWTWRETTMIVECKSP
jgi:hypothetical protein